MEDDGDRLVKLFVAIYDQEGSVFNHWALWVEDTLVKRNSFIIQAMGGTGRFRLEMRPHNARTSRSILELHEVSQIWLSAIPDIRQYAEEVEIKNEDPAWNCQDFVMTLLTRLMEAETIVFSEEEWDEMWHRQDGIERIE